SGGAGAPPLRFEPNRFRLLEQAQYVLVGLRGDRQRRGRQLLAGLQREKVGAFLVGIRQRQVVGAGAEGVDRRLGEVLAGLHGRQAGAQRLRLRAQGRQRRRQVVERDLDVGVAGGGVTPRGRLGDRQAGRRVGHTSDGQLGGA